MDQTTIFSITSILFIIVHLYVTIISYNNSDVKDEPIEYEKAPIIKNRGNYSES